MAVAEGHLITAADRNLERRSTARIPTARKLWFVRWRQGGDSFLNPYHLPSKLSIVLYGPSGLGEFRFIRSRAQIAALCSQ